MTSRPLRSQLWLTGALLIIGLTGYHGKLWAAPAPASSWTAQPYAYLVIDQDVRAVLEALGSNLGVGLVVADSVKGKIRSKVLGRTAGQFLDEISQAQGLSWYFDGSTLFVDRALNSTRRTFDTQALPASSVQQALLSLSGGGQRTHLHIDTTARQVVASGPAGYLGLIDRQLAALRPAQPTVAREARAATPIRIFRGGADTQVVSARP